MKIHEYQGKEILRQFGVPVPRGIAAFTVEEAVAAAEKLGGPVWVVKAQIHAGGRGKGGGVKVAKSIEQVKELAEQILGMQLKTHQTGPEGQEVRRIYIEDGADIKKEYYVSIVTDRASQKVAVIAFKDLRAGAWSQTQMLAAQSGVDAYRAKDGEALQILLNELSYRTLVLIDTPGVQLSEVHAELQKLCPQAQWHAVVPADTSATTLRKMGALNCWQSWFVSKIDESDAPWPLIQHMMQASQPLGLSCASGSDKIEDGFLELSPMLLAELALAPCATGIDSTAQTRTVRSSTPLEMH